MLAEFVHVDQRFLRRGRAGPDHRVDQRGEAIRLADDHAGVFAQVLVQLALEQLRGAAQAAERILDLVRELPNHLAAAVEARMSSFSRVMRWRCVASAISSSRYLRSNSLSSGVMVTSMYARSRAPRAAAPNLALGKCLAGIDSARISGLSDSASSTSERNGLPRAWLTLTASRSCAATLA